MRQPDFLLRFWKPRQPSCIENTTTFSSVGNQNWKGNAAGSVRDPASSRARPRRRMTWSEKLLQAFLKSAHPAMVTAVFLIRNSAMRQFEIRELPRTRYDDSRQI